MLHYFTLKRLFNHGLSSQTIDPNSFDDFCHHPFLHDGATKIHPVSVHYYSEIKFSMSKVTVQYDLEFVVYFCHLSVILFPLSERIN